SKSDVGGLEPLAGADRAPDLGLRGEDGPSSVDLPTDLEGAPRQRFSHGDLSAHFELARQFEGPAYGEPSPHLHAASLAVPVDPPQAPDLEVLEREVPVRGHHPTGLDAASLGGVVELRDAPDLESSELERSVGRELAPHFDRAPDDAPGQADDPSDLDRVELHVVQVHRAAGFDRLGRELS